MHITFCEMVMNALKLDNLKQKIIKNIKNYLAPQTLMYKS